MVLRLLILTLLIASGCTEPPADPEYDHPFDPAVPDDPFELMASFTVGRADGITLEWNDVSMLVPVARYEVLRSLSPDDDFAPTLEQPEIINDVLVPGMVDPNFVPNVTNYYKVRAVDPDGGSSSISNVAAAAIAAPVYVGLVGAGNTSLTQFVTVEARSSLADTIELDDSEDFDNPLSFGVDDADSTVITPWTLGPASAQRDTLSIYARALQGTTVTGTGQWDVTAMFNPQLTLDNGLVTSVINASTVLRFDPTGVLGYRVAATEAELSALPWLAAPADSVFAWAMDTGDTAPQSVFAEFDGDFGYQTMDDIDLTPAGPAVLNGLSVADQDSVNTGKIGIRIDATNALEMRLSEDPGFAGSSWQAFAPVDSFVLSPGVGEKTVYVVVRHDFDPDGDAGEIRVMVVDPN